MMRIDGRKNDEMRHVAISSGVNPYAEGSAEVSFGRTKVLVTASLEKEVPDWMKERGSGWITAEYGMLPRSTHSRNKREASSGKQSGRTQEIQRLIGRALRQAVDLEALGPVSIRLDCDVLVADGGTRTAAISGAWVALREALNWAEREGILRSSVQMHQVAAVSVGSLGGVSLLDLNYEEDSRADFDLNLVYRGDGAVIEIQGCGEKEPLAVEEILRLAELARRGCENIFARQREAVRT